MPSYFLPAELVSSELIGCSLVKCQAGGSLLWGVIVVIEAYSQDDPATRGYHRYSLTNKTVFCEPGHLGVAWTLMD